MDEKMNEIMNDVIYKDDVERMIKKEMEHVKMNSERFNKNLQMLRRS